MDAKMPGCPSVRQKRLCIGSATTRYRTADWPSSGATPFRRVTSATTRSDRLHVIPKAFYARSSVAVMLMPLLSGCQTWHPAVIGPHDLIGSEHPSAVRATLMNGEMVTLSSPAMSNDSIVSTDAGGAAVAVEDARLLEVRQFSLVKTIGLAIGIGLIAVGWTRAATGANRGTEAVPGPLPKTGG
jgi:hypothetical protein